MRTQGDDIVAKAKEYLGVTEEPAGSNNVLFNTDYYGRVIKSSAYSWCATFVWDIFRMCGCKKFYYGGNKTASCTTLMNYYRKKHPTWVITRVQDAAAGDIVLYQFNAAKRKQGLAGHVGIFDQAISGTSFYSIEGNTAATDKGVQDNGGIVARKVRKKSHMMCIIHLPFGVSMIQRPIMPELDYSLVFDSAYYSSHYADLKAAFGTAREWLLKHFMEYGMREGRQANETFNVLAYRERYADLQAAFGEDLPMYYIHYMQYGFREGRNSTIGSVDIMK